MQFLFAFLAQTSAQKGALWWASHHRLHHKLSDQPGDVHSAKLDGFWWSHVGWILSGVHDEMSPLPRRPDSLLDSSPTCSRSGPGTCDFS